MSRSPLAGYQELLLKLNRIQADAPVAAAFGSYDGLQDAMIEAKERAPKDTEAMAKSGYVTPPEVRQGSSAHIEAGFGGPSAEYVVKQHESTELNHPNGGEAKFFERALSAHRDRMRQKIADAVKAFLATGRTNPVSKRVPATPWEG